MIKKSVLFIATFFMLLTSILTIRASASDIIDIPDENLKIALNKVLGHSARSEITKKQLLTLTVVNLNDYNIENLEGLEYATNIKLLRLHNNQISDLSPLSSLTQLQYLVLTNNDIQDVSALSNLEYLTLLNLASNQITDLNSISQLNHLVYLYVADNNIQNILPITNLSDLEIIDLSNNHIKDISQFKNLATYLYGWVHEQTIDLGEYTVNKDSTLRVENPLKDMNGAITKLNVVDGYYDFETNEIVWENITEAKQLLVTFNEIATSLDGVEIEFSGSVTAQVNLDLGESPVITGADDITISFGTEFNPLEGVSADDLEDGDLTNKIQVSGSVDITTMGQYELIYTVTDSAGNTTTVNRIVSVMVASSIINKHPIIHAADKIIKLGQSFNPLEGVTADDFEDGNLTDKIQVIQNDVNQSVEGSYLVTYEVSDTEGLTTKKSISVTVMNQGIPQTGISNWPLLGLGIVLCVGGIIVNSKKKQSLHQKWCLTK